MAFVVSGFNGKRTRSQERMVAASALVLACRWVEVGFKDVTIAEGESAPETIEEFRERIHPRSKNAEAPSGPNA